MKANRCEESPLLRLREEADSRAKSHVLGTDCRGDITLVVEYAKFPFNDLTNCNCDGKRGSYFVGSCCWCYSCWDIFYDDFLQEIGDIRGAKVIIYVHHQVTVYRCAFDLLQRNTTSCRSECWSRVNSTPTTPQVPGLVVVVVESTPSAEVIDIVSSVGDGGDAIVVVGVGSNVGRRDLLPLATTDNRLMMVEDRDELLRSASMIRQKACNSCQKDVTFVMAWDEVSSGRQSWGWCSGGLISEFLKTMGDQLAVTSIDWLPDGSANGCQMNWRDFSSNCSCHKSQWKELSPSLLYENIVNRFSNLRPEYPNVAVLITDRHVGFSPEDTQVFRDNNVLVITVEIGNNESQEELRALATSSNVSFSLGNWSSLSGLIPELRDLVCNDISLQPNTVACDTRTDITLLVDLSHSMTKYVPSIITLLTTFLKTLTVADMDQHVTLITFSSEVTIVLENSVNVSDLLAAINDLKPQHGVSDLSGALAQAVNVVKRSPRFLMDTGQTCPALVAFILSDGLSQSRADVLEAATNLKRLGVTISFLSFGIGSTVNEKEAIISNPCLLQSLNHSINYTFLTELHAEVVNDCSYTPANVTFIINVENEAVAQLYVGEFIKFTKSLSTAHNISVFHSSDILPTLPTDVTSHKTASSTLPEMLNEVQFPADVSGANCIIIISDDHVAAPAPLFRQIWRLADSGSKVMSVGIGRNVNDYVIERIASVPRYGFSSRPVWETDIPSMLWNRYCEACGFTTAIDLVFLVEASSQTFSQWNDVLTFLMDASDNFPVGRHNVMVSVVTFGQQTVAQILFNSYSNKMELFRSIHSLQPRSGPVDLTTAEQDVDSLFAGARGGRPEAKKVAVLVMAQVITRDLNTLEDTHVILMDIGAKRNYSPSRFLKSSDICIHLEGTDDLVTHSRDLHDIVCTPGP
ncbi:collagen alpha-6(VI) chain-like [Haliotis asinina]|uniref:collagen alpha-6(VI) chain-like n=1 Tax=Haliotis asinina TaxID=109174 RepID=UPI00353270DE